MAILLILGAFSLLLAAWACWLAGRREAMQRVRVPADQGSWPGQSPELELVPGESGQAAMQRHHAYLESRLLGGGRSLWRRQASRRPWLAELALLLRQAGFIGTRAQVQVVGSVLLVALGAVACGILFGWQQGQAWPRAILGGLAFGLLVGVLGWWWIKRCRARRTARLDEEVEMVVQVTRMLWDAGMTLEGVLRSLIINLAPVAPESVRELRLALHRIEAGQAREEVLEGLAEIQRCEGLQDLLKLLAQVSASGGGARQSLVTLSDLIRDRRRTRIQEMVTKMSGKMSLVMMLFLFPALLIVLAGPAVINLGGLFDALGN
ncbi:type II secretion system F family protein [Bisbaumannia pacifica]|uniref:Type II secretion system F family protein n=1 Tax=Bisbaumannia pacifica TaxID=77098 RepID=A0A510X8W9_9GAMM|nr:type II secretion system F family protein [Halomonas pacifica]MBH8581509.1 type II secretion system F family protein [Halomonas pacifica]GEK47844.1 type II secretion system protein TadC [Halomonas pacifica]